jgi:hypothetical protein
MQRFLPLKKVAPACGIWWYLEDWLCYYSCSISSYYCWPVTDLETLWPILIKERIPSGWIEFLLPMGQIWNEYKILNRKLYLRTGGKICIWVRRKYWRSCKIFNLVGTLSCCNSQEVVISVGTFMYGKCPFCIGQCHGTKRICLWETHITYRYIGGIPAAQQANFKSLCTWRFLYIRIVRVFRLGCSASSYFVINSVSCRWVGAQLSLQSFCDVTCKTIYYHYMLAGLNDDWIHPTVTAICLDRIDSTTVGNICPECQFQPAIWVLARKCHHKNMGFCI